MSGIYTGKPSGRTGNQIFQFCVGHILASGLGVGFESFPIKGHPGLVSSQPGIPDRERLNRLKLKFRGHGGKFRPWADVMKSAKEHKGVSVIGAGPQNIQYIKPYRDHIRKWLGYDKAGESIKEILCHVRLTDYVNLKWAMTPEYYLLILRRFKKGLPNVPVRIVTDEPNHPMLSVFDEFDGEVLDLNPEETLNRLARSIWVIMPQSTFSFWPVWTSKNLAQAWMPLPNNSVWSPHVRYDKYGTRFDFVDLYDPDVFTPVYGAETIKERPEQLWGDVRK